MKYIIIILILSFLSSALYADVPLSAQLKLYEAYVDNLFQTAIPNSDYVTLMYFNAAYGLNPDTAFTYNSNISLFSQYSDLHYQIHNFGVDCQRTILDGKGVIYAGGGLGLRDNTSELAYYDYQNTGAYSTLKYYLAETAFAQIEYNAEYENRNNNSDYSALENSGAIQFSKSFNTRTTIQGRIETGRRDYVNLDGKHDSRLTGYVKIAQSLTERTGLQLQYRGHNTTQRLPYSVELLDGYNQIDDPDDEYAYSGSQWQLTLKSYTVWNMMLKSVLTREERSYNPAIIIEDSNALGRNDTVTTFLLGIDKKISTQNRFIPESTLSVEFMHRINKSSDPNYKSSTNILSIGTAFTF